MGFDHEQATERMGDLGLPDSIRLIWTRESGRVQMDMDYAQLCTLVTKRLETRFADLFARDIGLGREVSTEEPTAFQVAIVEAVQRMSRSMAGAFIPDVLQAFMYEQCGKTPDEDS